MTEGQQATSRAGIAGFGGAKAPLDARAPTEAAETVGG